MKYSNQLRFCILSLALILIFSAGLGAEGFKVYKVKKGDTLSKIAQEQLNDPRKWKEFLKFNKIDNPNVIRPGLELKIPDRLAKGFVAKPVARFQLFVGNVQVESNQKSNPAKSGENLMDGDIVKTGPHSRADIGYFGDPAVSVKMVENSSLEIQKKEGEVPSGKLSFGEALFSVFHKPGTKKKAYQVYTPSATAGVRGTVFKVSSDKNETSKFSCYNGIVDVSAQGKTVSLKKGFGTVVEQGKKPVDPFPVPGMIEVDLPQ